MTIISTLFTATPENLAAIYRDSLAVYDSEAHFRCSLAEELREFCELLESDKPLPESVLGLYDAAIGCTPR